MDTKRVLVDEIYTQDSSFTKRAIATGERLIKAYRSYVPRSTNGEPMTWVTGKEMRDGATYELVEQQAVHKEHSKESGNCATQLSNARIAIARDANKEARYFTLEVKDAVYPERDSNIFIATEGGKIISARYNGKHAYSNDPSLAEAARQARIAVEQVLAKDEPMRQKLIASGFKLPQEITDLLPEEGNWRDLGALPLAAPKAPPKPLAEIEQKKKCER